MDVNRIGRGLVGFLANKFQSVKRYLIRPEDRWACCVMGPLLWCQHEMISSYKLPPSGCPGPDIAMMMTETGSSSGFSVGWSLLHRKPNDLRLHDGVPVVAKWGFVLAGNPCMTVDELQSWHCVYLCRINFCHWMWWNRKQQEFKQSRREVRNKIFDRLVVLCVWGKLGRRLFFVFLITCYEALLKWPWFHPGILCVNSWLWLFNSAVL